MTHTPRTLLEAVKFFKNHENCHDFMVARRWPNGVVCPRCGSESVYYTASAKRWECKSKHAQRTFTLKTGTIFEDSALGLDKWLPCVWLIANAKNGISSHEIARALGVTQKTAWFMLQRIRLAMQDENDGGKLGGDGTEVEVDETYIGGKARNMHYAKRKALMSATLDQYGKPSKFNRWAGKQPVLGILERGADGTSRVRTKTVPDVRQHRLHREIVENIEEGSTVYTDDLHSYKNMPLEYEHQIINHANEYVRDNVHTNGLESYWSLLKRALGGTYVSVEPFHLFRYLDEQAFRFNNRKLNDAQRFVLAIAGIVGKRLTYAQLIAAADAATV